MTIAAGFCYAEGIVVCADSQFTAGNSKVVGEKTGRFTASWGQVIASFEGNAHYAVTAFQICQNRRESDDVRSDPIEGLRTLLHDHYHHSVFAHPDYADKPEDFDYTLFLGIRIQDEDPRLFKVTFGELKEMGGFDCAGAGEEWARTIMQYLFRPGLKAREAVCLASYVLAHVKVRAQYVGGPTSIKLMTKTEVIDIRESLDLMALTIHIENVANWFASECEQFLLKHALSNANDFEQLRAIFNERIAHLRSIWDAMQSDLANPQLTKADSSSLRPWPE